MLKVLIFSWCFYHRLYYLWYPIHRHHRHRNHRHLNLLIQELCIRFKTLLQRFGNLGILLPDQLSKI
jgi:hypothetical protein